jgi:hypothetical protein
MKKIYSHLFYFVCACILTSCMSMQSKSYVILNPDMSGKCTYEIKMGKDMAGILTMPKEDMYSGLGGYTGKSAKKSNQDVALALASKLLSSGTIDAWKDVQFGYLKKDTVFFKGTAYFKDITKMAVSMFDSAMKVYKNSDGNMVLEMIDSKKKKDTALSWTNHKYDSVYSNAYKSMGLSDLMHYYMVSMVRGLDISSTYQLPGKIISSSNFVRKKDNAVSISVTGNDIIKLLDTMASTDDIGSNMYSSYFTGMGIPGSQGNNGMGADNYGYLKMLYGEDKPVQVVFKNESKPVFDYVKEVVDAKKDYALFRKNSGIEKYDSLQAVAVKEAEEAKQKEEGTLVLTAADSANHKMYLKTLKAKQYGEYMSFSGTLSKGVKDNYGVKVVITKATTDKGVNVTDSINKGSSYLDVDDTAGPAGSKSIASAYLSSSNYSSYMDSTALYDLISFNLYGHFPSDAKYINLEGQVLLNADNKLSFKVIKLYPKKDEYDYSKFK